MSKSVKSVPKLQPAPKKAHDHTCHVPDDEMNRRPWTNAALKHFRRDGITVLNFRDENDHIDLRAAIAMVAERNSAKYERMRREDDEVDKKVNFAAKEVTRDGPDSVPITLVNNSGFVVTSGRADAMGRTDIQNAQLMNSATPQSSGFPKASAGGGPDLSANATPWNPPDAWFAPAQETRNQPPKTQLPLSLYSDETWAPSDADWSSVGKVLAERAAAGTDASIGTGTAASQLRSPAPQATNSPTPAAHSPSVVFASEQTSSTTRAETSPTYNPPAQPQFVQQGPLAVAYQQPMYAYPPQSSGQAYFLVQPQQPPSQQFYYVPTAAQGGQQLAQQPQYVQVQGAEGQIFLCPASTFYGSQQQHLRR